MIDSEYPGLKQILNIDHNDIVNSMSVQGRDKAALNYLGTYLDTTAGSVNLSFAKPMTAWFYWNNEEILIITESPLMGNPIAGAAYHVMPLKFSDFTMPKVSKFLVGCNVIFGDIWNLGMPKKKAESLLSAITG